jgi:hypothetical protein
MEMLDLTKYQSIQANHEHSHLSTKYSFIPTTQVVNQFEKMGWFPEKASQVAARKNEGFQKHLIRFRREHFDMIPGNIIPEIVLTNSHDGMASFQIMAGLFRVVCSNGLIVADSMFASHKIRHMGYTNQAVKMAIEDVTDSIPRVSGRIQEFREIEMTPDEKNVFAQAALEIKYGEDAPKYDTQRFLAPLRREDEKPTLWSTYNTAQEKLIKGGRFKEVENSWRHQKARGVKAIGEDVRINKALWMITEHFAAQKKAA